MLKQLHEYRREQKTQSTKEKQRKLLEKLEPEQPIQLSNMICQDRVIQNQL